MTHPEAEVLKLIAQGQSNDDIAAELVVSTNTVKTHTSSLLAKLNIRFSERHEYCG